MAGDSGATRGEVDAMRRSSRVWGVTRSASRAFLPSKTLTKPASPSSAGTRIAGLDGLRAIAVMIVFCAHYSVYLMPAHADLLERLFPGMLGVALFFTLSGYLISTLLMAEYTASGTISLKDFYLRRLFRLSPALYVYVSVTLFCYVLLDRKVQVGDFLAALFYVSNYYEIARHTALYYMPVWSLAIEEHFYIIFPLMMLLVMKRTPRAFMPLIVVLIVFEYIWRAHVARQPGVDWHWIYWRTDTRFDALLFGVLLMLGTQNSRPQWIRNTLVSDPAAILGVILMMVSVLYRNETFRMSARYTLQGASLALIIGYICQNAGRIAPLLRRHLDAPVPVYISKISYSLYLWHLTVIKFAEHAFKHVSPFLAVLLAATSFALAALSYKFVETPFISLRRRFGSHTAV